MVHVVLVITFFLAVLGRKRKIFLKVAFVNLFIFAALRYDFGSDYLSYYEKYSLITEYGQNPFSTEILYTMLNYIMPNFYILIVVTSAVWVITLYWFINKNILNITPKYVWISVGILLINPYIFLIELSSIRQCMALCLFIIAVEFACEKKLIWYLVFVFSATLFHLSAIVLLPLYWYINEQKITKKIVFPSLVVIVFLILNENVLKDIIYMVLELFDSPNYYYYFSQGSGNSLRATLLSSITLVYICINLPKMKGKGMIYSKLWLLGMICNVLAYRISMLTRVEMYFSVFSIVAFPMIILENRRYNFRKNQAMKFVNIYVFPTLIAVIYMFRYYSFFINPLWESFKDYKTIFSLW